MRRLEGGERERHLRAMEDATSSPGRTRAASSGTMDPARSDHGQRHKGQDAALARRKARGVTLHAQTIPSLEQSRQRLVGAPSPSISRETEERNAGDPLAQSRKQGPIYFVSRYAPSLFRPMHAASGRHNFTGARSNIAHSPF